MKAHHKETADQVEQRENTTRESCSVLTCVRHAHQADRFIRVFSLSDLRAYHHLTGQLSELSDLLESSSLDSGSSSSAPSEVESAEFDRLLSRVWHDASRQFDEEESTILATLEKVATAHELVDLGKRFIEMKPIQTQHKVS